MRVLPLLATLALLASAVFAEKCPLAGTGCPLYENHKVDTTGDKPAGCPAKGCPYYEQHKGNDQVVDLLLDETHKCPLSEKCGFYKALKSGDMDKINWTDSKCPLAEKCPYYKTVKENAKAHEACPILSKCPKAAEVHDAYTNVKNPHPPNYEKSAEECPYMKKMKAKKAAADHSKDEL
ncbi:hypothetical protein BJ742DRAFT_760580 [Cladochytrium replicatum]|nr:hypothetical protein BJ742DRAFT_760580 [Cladochytrium replicatum]